LIIFIFYWNIRFPFVIASFLELNILLLCSRRSYYISCLDLKRYFSNYISSELKPVFIDCLLYSSLIFRYFSWNVFSSFSKYSFYFMNCFVHASIYRPMKIDFCFISIISIYFFYIFSKRTPSYSLFLFFKIYDCWIMASMSFSSCIWKARFWLDSELMVNDYLWKFSHNLEQSSSGSSRLYIFSVALQFIS
jgi:hypothetical protein